MIIQGQDWEDLEKLFPDAAAFLTARSINNELQSLALELESKGITYERKKWVILRLNDIFASLNRMPEEKFRRILGLNEPEHLRIIRESEEGKYPDQEEEVQTATI